MRVAEYYQQLKTDGHFETWSIIRIFTIFVCLFATAALLSEGVFLQPNNLFNLLYQNTILMLVALGQLVVVLTGGIDLSLGAMVAVCSVLIVYFQDLGLMTSLVIAVAAAALFGLINGSLVTFVRLPAFVVTLAAMLIAQSVAKIFSKGGMMYVGFGGREIAPSLIDFYKNSLLGIPYPIIVCILAIIGVSLYLRTRTGHFTYAVGGNESAAYLSGIPVNRVKIAAYVLSAVLASLGSILFVSRIGMGDPNTGMWLLLDAVAAVTIGGASLFGGLGHVFGTVMGVLILGIINNIMNLLGIPPTIQPAVKGLVILLAVFINTKRKAN